MPFTFSHPAAILPLRYLPKRWISLAGLVIGSLTPDFEYFLRMRVYSSYSHTWIGMFWFDLPLAVLLTFIFHLIVRNSLIDNLPKFIARRLHVFKTLDWSKKFKETFIVVIISILLGVATHILWDSFTHENGEFVKAFDGLKGNLTIAGYSIPVYKLLQHVSTIFGGVIIIYALFQLPSEKGYQRRKSILLYWFLVAIISLTIVAIRLLTGLDYKEYGDLIVTIISGGLVALILASKLITLKSHNGS
jgi:hypothetical protein